MLHVVLFNFALVVTCAYAWAAGGQPERLTALLLLAGCAATFALPFHHHRSYRDFEVAAFAVDLVALVGFAAVAARANRYWPLWFTAVQLLTIAVHGVKGYQPDLMPAVYAAVVGKLAYPMLLILAVGVLRLRERERRHGRVADWSPLRWS